MNSEQSIFLNGRAQIVEMLQFMEPDHKEVLLKNLRMRNPALANELVEQSLTFDYIERLSDHELRIIINYVQATIMGMAMKNVKPSLQRKILSIAPRDYAEEAYSIMTRPLQNEEVHIRKAKVRVLDTLVSLYKKKQISLQN
ncbi:MAG: hypothetical protein KAQ98_00310 [Bacteriovoracaceae bacterium]|nr:hypothetical protein [Bacteriovoracaceae bacterium]